MKKSKAEAAAEPRKKRLTRSIKHNFSIEERLELGNTMTVKLNEIEAKQDEAKMVAQQFKAQVAQLEGELGTARNGFSAGFEMRSMEVIEVMDHPEMGKKEVCVEDKEFDSGLRLLFIEPMTFSDKNPPLIEVPPGKAPEPGQPLNSISDAVEKAEGEAQNAE